MDLYYLHRFNTNDFFVVAASNYEEARQTVAKECSMPEVWLDRNKSSCKRLTTEEDIRPLEVAIESLG